MLLFGIGGGVWRFRLGAEKTTPPPAPTPFKERGIGRGVQQGTGRGV